MKSIKLIFVLLILFTGQLFAQNEGDIIKVGDQIPSFTIVSDNGKKLNVASLKGKVIMISFFATWCPPCQKELAEIEQTLWPAFKDNKNFELLVIGREHSDAELMTYNEKKGFTFLLYPDKDRKVYSSFASSMIPRVYLIDKNGKVIYKSVGYNEADFNALMSTIRKAL